MEENILGMGEAVVTDKNGKNPVKEIFIIVERPISLAEKVVATARNEKIEPTRIKCLPVV